MRGGIDGYLGADEIYSMCNTDRTLHQLNSAGGMLREVIHVFLLSCNQKSSQIHNSRCSMAVLTQSPLIPDTYATYPPL